MMAKELEENYKNRIISPPNIIDRKDSGVKASKHNKIPESSSITEYMQKPALQKLDAKK
jgi:hypothetical protein